MKKSFLMLIAVFLLTALLIGGASAALNGSGTESDPWQINSSADLVSLSGNGYSSYVGANKYFQLNVDILSFPTGFSGIGNSSYPFNGRLDGGNHILTLNSSLIGYCQSSNNAELKNIIFQNCNSTYLLQNSGDICNNLNNIAIYNSGGTSCFPNTRYGKNMTNITVMNCTFSKNVFSFVNGLNNMFIENINVENVVCYDGIFNSFSNKTSTVKNVSVNNCFIYCNMYMGGLCYSTTPDNYQTCTIEKCSFTNSTLWENTTGTANVGILIGQTNPNNRIYTLNITDCHVKNCMVKTMNNTFKACGFMYSLESGGASVFNIENCSIENCNFSSTTGSKNPFTNYTAASIINSSFNNLTYDNYDYAFRLLSGASLTNDSSQFAPKNIGETVTFTLTGTEGAAVTSKGKSGYNFDYGTGGSKINNNPFTASYSTTGTKYVTFTISGLNIPNPYTLTTTAYIDIPEKLNGSGTQSDPYQVTSDEDLHSWSNYYFFYDTAYMAILQDFTPTTTVMEFNGHLNGNNHTLSNGKQPLFNKLGGTVQNLNFSDAIVNGNGLLATESSAAVSNVNADNCFVGGRTAGGLVGTASGSFTDCTVNHVTVKGTKSAGGISADGNTTIENCHVLNSDLLAPITYGVCADINHFSKKYTIVWDESSSTSNNITYADDAAGMSENDRNELIKDHTHFAVVQWNGSEPEVNYYLYRDNLNYKATDESCDTSSGEPSVLTGADGDVMVLYDTVCWTTSKIGNDWRITFTWDVDAVDNTWVSPHTYGDDLQHTSLAKYVGLGVFEGYIQNGQLRSINTSQTPTGSTTQNNFYIAATTGRNWQYNQTLPMTWAWYIIQLYFVKGDRNTQNAYGNGIVGASAVQPINTSWSASNAWNNGTTANQTSGVTALGVQNGWGNVYQFLGEIRYDNYVYTFSVLGGKDHNNIELGGASTWKSVTVSEASGNISQIIGTPEYPFFSNAGSETDYSQCYADYANQQNYSNRVVNISGGYNMGLRNGASFINSASLTNLNTPMGGSRLHVVIT